MYLHKGPSELFPYQRENVHVLCSMHNICFQMCPIKLVGSVVVLCPPCNHVIYVDSSRHWMGHCQLNAIHWDCVHLLLLVFASKLWVLDSAYNHAAAVPADAVHDCYEIFVATGTWYLEGAVRYSVFISSGRRCQMCYGNIFRWWCEMHRQVV